MYSREVLYFEKPGSQNTDLTLEVAKNKAQEQNIKDVIVASTKGDTGVKAAKIFKGHNLVVVSHCSGFREPNFQELSSEKGKEIKKEGGKILTCQHSFGGIGRAIRRKFNTYQVDEIVAHTFRTLGEGTKVAVEITLMACDAGLVPSGKEIISVGGTRTGADTALVIKGVNTHSFFELEIREIICKPRICR